eukprot:TRINITY_DN2057_c0_g2_i12.p1 TRINITY_DN2057_c0_g2~~TRINITY_DN2057_c0_g2_i12.p1  ORF type:complete len:663 (-),score=178.08 TRINITY_DN2057_c0_g2_i12:195-2183(-)
MLLATEPYDQGQGFEETWKLEAGTCASLRALSCKAIEQIVSEPPCPNANMQRARVLIRIGEWKAGGAPQLPQSAKLPGPHCPGPVNVRVSKLVDSKWETEAEVHVSVPRSSSASGSSSVAPPSRMSTETGASGSSGGPGPKQSSVPKTPYQVMLMRIQAIIAQHRHTDQFKEDLNKFVKKHRLRSEVSLALQMLSSSAAWGLMQAVGSGGAAYANDASILYQVRQLHETAADLIDQFMRMDPSAVPATWGYGYNPWSYAVQWGWMAAKQAKQAKKAKKDAKKKKKDKKESKKQKKGAREAKRKSSESSYTYESYEEEEEEEGCSSSKKPRHFRNEELEKESCSTSKRPRPPRNEELEEDEESCSTRKRPRPPSNEELEQESCSNSKSFKPDDQALRKEELEEEMDTSRERPKLEEEATPKNSNEPRVSTEVREESPMSAENTAPTQMDRLQALMEGLGSDDDAEEEENQEEEKREEEEKAEEEAEKAEEEQEEKESDAKQKESSETDTSRNLAANHRSDEDESQLGATSSLPDESAHCVSQQELPQAAQPEPVEQDLASTDDAAGLDTARDEAAAPNDNDMSEWLKRLDAGKGTLLQYLPALTREFDADLSQLPGVILREPKVPGIIGTIDPSMWKACGVVRMGHRMLLAKGINELASRQSL